MKYLVLYAHPNKKSFNNAILQTVVERLQALGQEVRVNDLYEQKFNPVMEMSDFNAVRSGTPPADVALQQEALKWADRLIVMYPIWWSWLPAMLKGWMDRVLTSGFAYKYDDGGVVPLLRDKQAIIFTTHGMPESYYKGEGIYKAYEKMVDAKVFGFCGIEVIAHRYFPSVPYVDETARAAMLEEVKNTLNMLVN